MGDGVARALSSHVLPLRKDSFPLPGAWNVHCACNLATSLCHPLPPQPQAFLSRAAPVG